MFLNVNEELDAAVIAPLHCCNIWVETAARQVDVT